MADSTLLRTGESAPGTLKGHGTSALGPSDSSDSGSDILGGPGLVHDEGIGLAQGTTSDPDLGLEPDAGADIGDADLDSDSDRFGTGERAAAGRDATTPVDRVLYDEQGKAIEGDAIADEAGADLGPGGDGDDADYADLDTTLDEDGDRADEADVDTDSAERTDVERGAHGGRANDKPVDDDIPLFDRAWRDDRPGT